jgi:hypothetical protein
MGTWAHDTFDNDTACDWAFGLEDVSDLSYVMGALARVLETGADYLEADLACEALAACEVIARLKGNSGVRNAYTDPVDSWVNAHPLPVSSPMAAQAAAVIDRVLSPPSELLELWKDGKDPDQWHNAVSSLRARVVG